MMKRMATEAEGRLRRITSAQNAVVKELRRAFSRGECTEDGFCAIESVHIIEEAIRSGLQGGIGQSGHLAIGRSGGKAWRHRDLGGMMKRMATEAEGRLRRITSAQNAVVKELRRAFSRGECTEDGYCAAEDLVGQHQHVDSSPDLRQ